MRTWLVAVALLPLLGGCATKRDVRDLRDEMAGLRAAQDSMLREIQRQNRMMLDSLSSQEVRTRGDLATRLLNVERQLVQVQELTGQGQQRLAELREEMNARARELEARGTARADTAPAPAGNPEEVFNLALASLRRGSLVTARAGFEEVLRLDPRHRLAGEAQFYIGETYNEGKNPERALQAYALVLQSYPDSPKAPTALYRAGTIEAARGNRTEARALFDQVVKSYPDSPEAALARTELQKLRRR